MFINFGFFVKWWNKKSELFRIVFITAIPCAYVASYIISDILNMLRN
ncbi:Uncharacterised protein [Citrobacter koseri]|uniref:Uncharacterized protein n=1 Tax=Citrobacter koseri TaxID=545 RepID=A0A447UQR0_CITKO|nr:Uncharacterised protein [Citrobacter koseri]